MNVGRIAKWIILLGLELMLDAMPADAEGPPVGRIEQVRGMVTIVKSDGRQVGAQAGIALFSGDQVTAGEDAEVLFSVHEAEFRLGRDSQIVIDDLSAQDVEDGETVMALILGFLRSKVGRLLGSPGGFQLHTPTAVVGVRGTEFDTVVSMDAASAVVVDEGEVQIDWEGQQGALGQGQMLEVEMGGKEWLPKRAAPRDKRDWESWRQKRIQRLFRHLPVLAPRFASKFDRTVVRSDQFSGRVNAQAERVRKGIKSVRRATEISRREARLAAQHLKQEVLKFKEMVQKFRHAKNRVRAMARLSKRVERFVEQKGERFTDRERSVIESSLKDISGKRQELREIFSSTTANIRETFKELREWKAEVMQRRGGRGG
ncbi:MAG: FecR domain-containing protein [Deltaproteobacteria bacterium]|nr:FecR domain-containing protein [Deltaproteobacteria bacterium]